MKLFLDDVRNPPDDSWIIARNIKEFKHFVLNGEPITHISFDHDLGEENGTTLPTGMDAAKWFIELCLDKPQYGENLELVAVHSSNPAGAENIRSYFESAQAHGVFSTNLKIVRR